MSVVHCNIIRATDNTSSQVQHSDANCACGVPCPRQDYGHHNVGFGEHGSPNAPTPTLNKLAAEGVILDRFHAYKFCRYTHTWTHPMSTPLNTFAYPHGLCARCYVKLTLLTTNRATTALHGVRSCLGASQSTSTRRTGRVRKTAASTLGWPSSLRSSRSKDTIVGWPASGTVGSQMNWVWRSAT